LNAIKKCFFLDNTALGVYLKAYFTQMYQGVLYEKVFVVGSVVHWSGIECR
jgi:hypothetical protein